jgi:hypothetical protein
LQELKLIKIKKKIKKTRRRKRKKRRSQKKKIKMESSQQCNKLNGQRTPLLKVNLDYLLMMKLTL